MTELEPKLKKAVDMAMSVLPGEMGCDDAFDYLAAYAEHVMHGTDVPDSLKMTREHLDRCSSCMEELDYLLETMKAQDQLLG
jgi:hypothetical protein